MPIHYQANPPKTAPGELHNGDCMDQDVFHKLYERMDEDFCAELINGVVLVREPAGRPHSLSHMRLGTLIDIYSGCTPGLEACSGATTILSKKDEVEPDVVLRVLPTYGGQTEDFQSRKRRVSSSSGKRRVSYIKGAPELVAEVAHTSWAMDLHVKLERYRVAGVIEYMVLCLANGTIQWFDFNGDHMIEADANGIFRSRVFPGLWINAPAVFSMDYQAAVHTLNLGIASAEHADFIDKLAAARSL